MLCREAVYPNMRCTLPANHEGLHAGTTPCGKGYKTAAGIWHWCQLEEFHDGKCGKFS